MILKPLRKHSDSRGDLVENTIPEIMKNSKHFFISKSAPGVIRGNHYHENKSEWFVIIQGSCQIIVEDVQTKQRDEKTISSEDNVAIYMEPGKAHAFKNVGENEMILCAFINEVFDPKKPDTHSYKLL